MKNREGKGVKKTEMHQLAKRKLQTVLIVIAIPEGKKREKRQKKKKTLKK